MKYTFLFYFLLIQLAFSQNLFSQESSWSFVGDQYIAEDVLGIQIQVDSIGVPYFSYSTYNQLNMKKFNPPSWENIYGLPNASNEHSFKISPTGELYLAYYCETWSYIEILHYTGTGWETIGNRIPQFWVVDIDLAFDSTGIPWICFVSDESNDKTCTYKLEGSNWIMVGNASVSVGTIINFSFNISPSGIPYIAFTDDFADKLSVIKFDGNNWIFVGPQYISPTYCGWKLCLGFNADGLPGVAFCDEIDGYKARLIEYDGTEWKTIGENGFSEGRADDFQLVYDKSGRPYVSFIDYYYNERLSVMQYNGIDWLYVGVPGFSNDSLTSNVMAIGIDDQLYVAYKKFYFASVMKFDSVSSGLEKNDRIAFSVYPNPAEGRIAIDLSSFGTGLKKLQVYDTKGCLKQFLNTDQNSFILDLRDMLKGMYVIKVSDEKFISYKKIISI